MYQRQCVRLRLRIQRLQDAYDRARSSRRPICVNHTSDEYSNCTRCRALYWQRFLNRIEEQELHPRRARHLPRPRLRSTPTPPSLPDLTPLPSSGSVKEEAEPMQVSHPMILPPWAVKPEPPTISMSNCPKSEPATTVKEEPEDV